MRLRVLKSVDRPLETYAQGLRLCGNEISALGANAFTGINEISKRFVLIVPAILYDALQLPRFKKRTQLENYALIDSIAWKVLNEVSRDNLMPLS